MFGSLFSKPAPRPEPTAEEAAVSKAKRERDNAWHDASVRWREAYEEYSPGTSYEHCFGPMVPARLGQLLEEIVELKKRVAVLEAANDAR